MAVSNQRRLAACAVAALGCATIAACIAQAQPVTTQPTTAPAPTTQQSTYDRLLGNVDTDRVDVPIQPVGPGQMIDQTTGINAVPPNAPQQATRRDGSAFPRKVGRMTPSTDPGGGWEFTLDADGQAMQDPPLKLLPNLKLLAMEQQREMLNRDVRFRVSGLVTEYKGRNYLLVEEVVVVRDPP